ncbi:hypothetical protein CEXT_251491 [Caerostris extrusa]|uniref:Uncharacterized protein n=1 Tax=Caerostris extrusa TaxID=172846 RepID=A0AAV4NGQ5_CAEEX|nr:hypothetical protein CEXT_251491 [Caerostris extrusa]
MVGRRKATGNLMSQKVNNQVECGCVYVDRILGTIRGVGVAATISTAADQHPLFENVLVQVAVTMVDTHARGSFSDQCHVWAPGNSTN